MLAPFEVQAAPVAATPVAVTPFVHPHVLTTQVCAEPEAAVADMVYPASQLLQSTVAVSHNVPPDPVASVSVPSGQVQELGTQDKVLN